MGCGYVCTRFAIRHSSVFMLFLMSDLNKLSEEINLKIFPQQKEGGNLEHSLLQSTWTNSNVKTFSKKFALHAFSNHQIFVHNNIITPVH